METKRKKILSKLKESVIKYDKESAKKAAQEALEAGIDPHKAIDSLAAGLRDLGELYEKEVFIPELIMAVDALHEGSEVLRAHLPLKAGKKKGVVIIGTVEGDTHFMGKDLVKYMIEAHGSRVIDLGYDVKAERFIEEAKKTNADLIAISALMSSTMKEMKKIIDMVHERNLDVKVMVGGGPVTGEIAKLYGADGWALNAADAAKKAVELIKNQKGARVKGS
jgi:methanogenic corrinoid protein MtbC1